MTWKFNKDKVIIAVYSNPATTELYVVAVKLAPGVPVTVNLLDAAGKKYLKQFVQPVGNKLHIILPKTLSSGLYYLQLEYNAEFLSGPKSIFIQKQ